MKYTVDKGIYPKEFHTLNSMFYSVLCSGKNVDFKFAFY